MMEFHKYAKIKDRYCLCYFGPSDEYLTQLKLLKPILERNFVGLKIFICCRDDRLHLLSGMADAFQTSELRNRSGDFAHVKELRFNGKSHPIEDLLIESGITDCVIRRDLEEIHTNKCLIVTNGSHPTKNLEKRLVDQLRKQALEDGYDTEIDGDPKGVGLVMGVESSILFDAASRGIRTVLVPTGLGTRLYLKMFPNANVLA